MPDVFGCVRGACAEGIERVAHSPRRPPAPQCWVTDDESALLRAGADPMPPVKKKGLYKSESVKTYLLPGGGGKVSDFQARGASGEGQGDPGARKRPDYSKKIKILRKLVKIHFQRPSGKKVFLRPDMGH